MSYFGYWAIERQNAAQVFSDPRKPVRGFCKTFFQITDEMILNKRLGKIKGEIGTIYDDSNLPNSLETSNQGKPKYRFLKKLKNIKGPFEKLLRKKLWREKDWKTQKLLDWADSFRPEVVYCSFSDDFFILKMSLFFAKRYSVPLILQIGDDYIFNGHFSISPFYWIYRTEFKRLVKKVFAYNTYVLYGTKKIEERYRASFSNPSSVIYISSDFSKANKLSDSSKKSIVYVGNTKLGRYKSIIEVGRALQEIDESLYVDVYSPEDDKRIIHKLNGAKGINFHGHISYNEVEKVLLRSDLILISESFAKKDIRTTAYSLSTKVADGLSSGIPIFAYGPKEAGFIGYLSNQKCCVCYNKQDLIPMLKKILFDNNYRNEVSEIELHLADKNHRQNITSSEFVELVKRSLAEYKN